MNKIKKSFINASDFAKEFGLDYYKEWDKNMNIVGKILTFFVPLSMITVSWLFVPFIFLFELLSKDE